MATPTTVGATNEMQPCSGATLSGVSGRGLKQRREWAVYRSGPRDWRAGRFRDGTGETKKDKRQAVGPSGLSGLVVLRREDGFLASCNLAAARPGGDSRKAVTQRERGVQAATTTTANQQLTARAGIG